jgi:hypothetical protein
MKAIRLTELPSILRNAGYAELPPYRTIYTAALNGEFPAKQINRIWHAEVADIDAIAGALGLQRGALVTDKSAATATTARI